MLGVEYYLQGGTDWPVDALGFGLERVDVGAGVSEKRVATLLVALM